MIFHQISSPVKGQISIMVFNYGAASHVQSACGYIWYETHNKMACVYISANLMALAMANFPKLYQIHKSGWEKESYRWKYGPPNSLSYMYMDMYILMYCITRYGIALGDGLNCRVTYTGDTTPPSVMQRTKHKYII